MPTRRHLFFFLGDILKEKGCEIVKRSIVAFIVLLAGCTVQQDQANVKQLEQIITKQQATIEQLQEKNKQLQQENEQLKSEAKQVNSFYVLFLNKKAVNGSLLESFMMNGRHRRIKGVQPRTPFILFLF